MVAVLGSWLSAARSIAAPDLLAAAYGRVVYRHKPTPRNQYTSVITLMPTILASHGAVEKTASAENSVQ